MFAYAAYVLLFPLALGVTATTGDVRVTLDSFTAQRANLARVLGDGQVNELVADRPRMAAKRFSRWWWTVSLTYVLAAGAMVAAAIWMPTLLGPGGQVDAASGPGIAPSEGHTTQSTPKSLSRSLCSECRLSVVASSGRGGPSTVIHMVERN